MNIEAKELNLIYRDFYTQPFFWKLTKHKFVFKYLQLSLSKDINKGKLF